MSGLNYYNCPRTPEIAEALARAQVAFQGVPRPRRLTGVDYILEQVGASTLISTPLRELTPEQLNHYAFRALTTVGTRNDFRYFWPQLMAASVDSEMLTDREVLFGKLACARWWRWPEPEQAAIEAFVRAVSNTWRLYVYPEDSSLLDSWVCAFGQFVPDITPYLAPLADTTRAAARNRAHLIDYNMPELADGMLCSAFWSRHPDYSVRHPAWPRTHPEGRREANPNYSRVLAFLTDAWRKKRRPRRER